MKPLTKRPITILAINLVVFCVLAEALALTIFYYRHGWLFYLDPYRPTYAPIPETQNQSLAREGLHPYFGPTHKPGIPFDIPESLRAEQSARGASQVSARLPGVKTNNFGFSSPYNYPFHKIRTDQFVIGIFGGSVGDWFCQLGTGRLVERLKQNGFFRNRELIPLCFSHEGYKQPQQLLVLAYFLSIGQQFDLVVNIDGFNEVALSSQNNQHGLDISMPSFGHIDPLINLVNQATLTPPKLESLARISRYKEQLNGLAERINRSRFASSNFVLEQYYGVVSKRYQAELIAFDKMPSNPSDNSLIHVTPAVTRREGATLFEEIARNWASSSVLMNHLLSPRAVPYFDFLQPNQYFTTRKFGNDEARLALTDESPFKRSVEEGYPFLLKETESGILKDNTVNVFDATHVFDREASKVYMDNCCHYTVTGNEILADFIVTSVLSSRGPWKSVSD